MNDFRKAIYLKRLELAKINERLEQDTGGSEKPSFDVVYAEKTELDSVSLENCFDFVIVE